VTLDLRIRGEAAHAATHDLAHPGERTRRKRPAPTVSEIEDPEASAVEVDRVNIDLIPEIVLKNEMSRSSTRLEAIANGSQSVLQLGDVSRVQNEIQVRVLTGLLAEQSIHAPPSIQPHPNAVPFQRRDYFNNCFRIHPSTSLAHATAESSGQVCRMKLAERA